MIRYLNKKTNDYIFYFIIILLIFVVLITKKSEIKQWVKLTFFNNCELVDIKVENNKVKECWECKDGKIYWR